MEAFIALESLLEYFVFSTADTQQHEDDLIAHSKVSKGEAVASKGKYSPKFYATIHPATFTFIIFLFFAFSSHRHLSWLYRIVLLSPISYQYHLILHMLQVFPASGEVPYGGSSASACACASGCPSASASGGASGGPSGGALPSKVIPGPSPLLTLIHCLIKVDKSFLCFFVSQSISFIYHFDKAYKGLYLY